MKFSSKEEVCLEIWGAVCMVSPNAGDSPVSTLMCSCAILLLSLGACLPGLESVLCNVARLWAVGSEQGLGAPEMESVLSPTPTGVQSWGDGGGEHAGEA